MRRVLTVAEMRIADRRTIEEVGLPGPVLMENAGTAVARLIQERFPGARRIAVLCGRGNNGGDGFVVSRRLLALRPETWLAGEISGVAGDACLHMRAYQRSGGEVREILDLNAWESVRERALSADLVVDALLGTGLRERPAGLVGRMVEDLAGQSRRGTPVVAVDIPSGVSSDSGALAWPAVKAALTVTFGAAKVGHVLPPACDLVGELVVADIGIPEQVLADCGAKLWLLDEGDAGRAFPARSPGSHKGDYGHLLLVAGSVGKSGAAILAARAALLTGVGLVTVATPAPVLPQVAAGRPEIMTEPLPAGPEGSLAVEGLERALALASTRNAVVLGPGIGLNPSTQAFAQGLYDACDRPLLVDADGLNALAARAGGRGLSRRGTVTVLTPHPGEMARLSGVSAAEVQGRRLESARGLAEQSDAWVVLKGQRTLVADPEGRVAVNPTGNPGMASGGTGDVLAGIVGALLAMGREAWVAASAGVYVHGLAGDRALSRQGPESLLAGDLLDEMPGAIRWVRAHSRTDAPRTEGR